MIETLECRLAPAVIAGELTPPVATKVIPFTNVPVFHFTDDNPGVTMGDFAATVWLGDNNQVTLTSTFGPNGQVVAAADGFDVQLSYTYQESFSNHNFRVVVSDGQSQADVLFSMFSVAGPQPVVTVTDTVSRSIVAAGVAAGQKDTYSFTVTNNSPEGVRPVTVTALSDERLGDLLPAFVQANGNSAVLGTGQSVTFQVDTTLPVGRAGDELRTTVTVTASENDGGYHFTDISHPATDVSLNSSNALLNDAGKVLFEGRTAAGARVLFLGDGTNLAPFVSLGGPLDNKGVGIGGFNNHDVAVLAVLEGWEPGTPPIYVAAQDMLTGLNLIDWHIDGVLGINDAGIILFAGTRPGVYAGHVLLGEGTAFVPLPYRYSDVDGDLNNAGHVAFLQTLDSGARELYLFHNGLLSLLTSTSGETYSIGSPNLNNLDQVAATGGHVTNGTYVYRADVHGMIRLVESADGIYRGFDRAGLNDAGEIVFGADALNTHGLFTGPDPYRDRVIVIGDRLFGSTVRDIRFNACHGLNNEGQLAFVAELADHRFVVVRADPAPGTGLGRPLIATATATVTYDNLPVPTITGARAQYPVEQTITLGSTVFEADDPGSAGTYAYAWTVTRDSAPFAAGTDPSFTFTPDLVGTYLVNLTVTNQAGKTGADDTSVLALRGFTVSNAADSGPGSLRQAILDANSTPNSSGDPDLIVFQIGSGAQTINLESQLPTVTDAVFIDGTSQPGYGGMPLIKLDGAGAAGYGLVFANASYSTVRAIDVSGTGSGRAGFGLYFYASSDMTVESVKAQNRDRAIFSEAYDSAAVTAPSHYLNNDLSNSNWGLSVGADIHFVASGNNYTGDSNGWGLSWMTGLTLTRANFEAAAGHTPGFAVAISNSSNCTIDGLDVSWTGNGRSGYGVYFYGSSGMTVQNVFAYNRDRAIFSDAYDSAAVTAPNRYLNNELMYSNWGLSIGADIHFVASGNNYYGDSNGWSLSWMTGLTLTPANFEAAAGHTPGIDVAISNSSNCTIDGLDVSWSGSGRSGTGVYLYASSGITVENVKAQNRDRAIFSDAYNSAYVTAPSHYLNNDLSNSNWGLSVGADIHFVASGNNYTGDSNGWSLSWMTGLNLTAANFEAAAGHTPGFAVAISNSSICTIDGLDVSWSGSGRSGIGVYLLFSSGMTVQNVSAQNRDRAIVSEFYDAAYVTAPSHYLNNDLSNSNWGLNVGADIHFVAAGNNYTGDSNGWWLSWMTGLTLTPANFEAAAGHTPGSDVVISNSSNCTIDGLDVSWTSSGRSGIGVYLLFSSGMTVQNVSAQNRDRAIVSEFYDAAYVTAPSHYLNNDLSNSNWGLNVGADIHFVASRNNYTGDSNGWSLSWMTGLNLTAANFEVAAGHTPGYAVEFWNSQNCMIDGLDVSWTGNGRSGRGLHLIQSSGMTVQNVLIVNRDIGFSSEYYGFASSASLLGNSTLVGNTTAVYIIAPNQRVESNLISDNTVGIAVGDVNGTSVTHNDIERNVSAGIINYGSGVVATQSNYWGAADGPGPAGSGDVIQGNVADGGFLTEAPEFVGVPTVVSNTRDSGPGSLRSAITYANQTAGTQTIRFAIPVIGAHTIHPLGALPALTDSVIIDGTTQPGFDAAQPRPMIELDGSGAGSVDGLTIASANSTVRGLIVNGFAGNGITITGAGATGDIIEGNFIGTDVTGTAAAGNGGAGIWITDGASNNTIGGASAAATNVIAGDQPGGVLVVDASATGNVLQGTLRIQGDLSTSFLGANLGTSTAPIPQIAIDGSLTSTGVLKVHFLNSLTIGGDLAGTIKGFGDDPSVSTIQTITVGGSVTDTGSITAPLLDTVQMDGNLAGIIHETNPTLDMRRLIVGGSITTTAAVTAASIDQVAVAQNLAGQMSTAGAINTLSITGNLSGSVTAASVTNVTTGGDLSGQITATVFVGAVEVGGANTGTVTTPIKIDQSIIVASLSGHRYGESFVVAHASSGLPVTVQVVSGPAVAAGATLTIIGVGAIVVAVSQDGDTAFNATSIVNVSLDAAKAPLTIRADDQVMDYGGSRPALTATFTGLVHGDTPAAVSGLVLTTAPANSHVGAYAIVASGMAANYAITFINGTLSIKPVALSIRADEKAMVYGSARPPLTATFTGLVNGDTSAAVGGLTLVTVPANSHVGQYPITASGAIDPDYVISYTSGTLTIHAAILTVAGDNISRLYNTPNPRLTATITGYVNGDLPSVVSGSPDLTTTAMQSSAPGDYPINVGLGTLRAADYRFALINGMLTIISPGPSNLQISVSPSVMDEGSLTSLSGSFSDTGSGGHTVIVHWNDGSPGTVVSLAGGARTFSVSHPYLDNRPGDAAYTINVAVFDPFNASVMANASVVVRNRAPIAETPAGAALLVPGLMANYSVAFNDAGRLDTHSALVHWGDGTTSPANVSEANGSGTASASHVFTGPGNYTMTLTIADKDGAASTVAKQVSVVPAALLPDPINPGQQALYVGGTDYADAITIEQGGKNGPYKIAIETQNGVKWQGSIAGDVSRVVLYGLAGDDEITIAGNVAVPAWLYGGAGNDVLKAGNGNSVLLGGSGDDQLIGGKGRNLLIGGLGKDKLKSAGGDDILIGGFTDHDDNEAALNAILLEWTRTDLSYVQRVDHLLGNTTGGRNGSVLLTHHTVHDDGLEDQLTGGSGADLYFASLSDKITGRKKDEVVVWV